MTGRRLVLMRHAKAEPFASTDFQRHLTARGRADAAEAGRFLDECGVVLDHAVVSTAARAQETWAEVASAAGVALTPELSEELYAGGPHEVLEAVGRLPDSVRAAIVVGHNPTTAMVAALLDDGEGDPAATGDLLAGFPTAALVVFDVEGEWAGLAESGGRVRHFHVGRE